MTNNSPATEDRWAVSTRTNGEVLTAGVTLPSIELALLGIPQGFTPVEIQSWLRDLAGVAIETSRSDERTRPIPQLLHHALTGLLFSQTELWSHTGQSLPCAAVFVNGPNGTAFGWVGRARVMLLVNGEPYEPQWVIVRDEAGHEAMSAMMPPESHVLLTLEYWPQGEDGTQAPASVDAEAGHAHANLYQHGATPENASEVITLDLTDAPLPAAAPEPPATQRPSAIAAPLAPAPDSLPTQQPGLAPDPTSVALDRPDSAQSLPSTYHPSSGTFAMPQVPARGGAAPGPSEVSPSPLWSPDPAGKALKRMQRPGATEAGHPVGRWLSRFLTSFGRHEAVEQEPASDAPVSDYDAMLSPEASNPGPTSEPAPMRADARPAGPPPPPPQPIDISEPHALPDTAGLAAPPRPTPKPLRRGGLTAAGLQEILGSAAGAGAPDEAEPLLTPESTVPGTPLYPMLEVTPTKPMPPGPIQIEREPIGADETFAIPKLPPRETPKPARAPVPDTFVARGTPAAVPPSAAKPAAPQSPVLGTPGTPGTPGTRLRMPVVPEPPADFLAEFAASMRVEPEAEPAPEPEPLLTTPTAPEPRVSAGPPPLPPAMRGAAPPPRPAAPPAAGKPVVTAPKLTAAAAAPSPTPPAEVVRPAAPAAPAPRAAAPQAPPAAAPPPATPRAVAPPPAAPPAAAPPPAAPRAAAPPPTPPARAPRPEPPVLRAPTPQDPTQLAAADEATLMRELPLPTPSAEMARPVFPEVVTVPPDDEVPEGMLVATQSKPMPRGARSRLASWPAPEELEMTGTPPWRKPWLVGSVVAVLFAIGWLVGHSQAPDNDVHATPMSRLLRTVGLGGARFTALVDTDPPGAWIAVDGKDLGRRTPSTMELAPGQHQLTLSMPDLGDVKVTVNGAARQRVRVNEALHGSLDVTALDPAVPVKMLLDGAPAGWLPVHVEKLPPGLHELQFNGPNMPPWGQNVSVGIRQTTTIVARPMMSPATGVVEVQASLNDDSGTAPLSGANVFVDGDLRGSTPLTLELPRGPHSLKVTYRTETAPVQVIDLPGGNRRFASFQFGLDSDLPPMRLQGNYASLSGRKPVMVSASLDGLDVRDVRDAWMHVRSPEGLWRRYEMTVLPGPRGAVLSTEFPLGMFDAQGKVTWYASAATAQGDEFYTEMQHSSR